MKPRLTGSALAEMERQFQIEVELMEILGNVIAEWKSDPMSVQCFDLRMVERAKELWDQRDPLFK